MADYNSNLVPSNFTIQDALLIQGNSDKPQ